MFLRIGSFNTAVVMFLFSSVIMADYWHGDFLEDETTVFSSDAVLFSSPDLDSQVSADVPVSTAVDILGSEGQVSLPGGMKSYWYQVSFSEGGTDAEGYMPGVFLAMVSMELGGDSLLMFNVDGFDPETMEFSSRVILAEGTSIIEEMTFKPISGDFGDAPYGYSVRGTLMDCQGLDGVKQLLELSFIYEACGYLNRDLLIALTDNGFVMGPFADSQFEAATYRYIETFILPSDSGGAPQAVEIMAVASEWDEAADDYVETGSTSRGYFWNGQDFLQE